MRAALLIASLALALTPLAAAQAEDDLLVKEPRAKLEQICRDDGAPAAECACYGDVVEANFTQKEMAGAAFVLSDPAYEERPLDALGPLLAAGYSLGEVVDVVNKVQDLADETKARCET